jgi:hypothetical protein
MIKEVEFSENGEWIFLGLLALVFGYLGIVTLFASATFSSKKHDLEKEKSDEPRTS